jgi:hypothetical protein
MRHGSTVLAGAGWLAPVLLVLTSLSAGPDAPQAAAVEPFRVPDARLGVKTAPLLLLSRADVGADVGLSAEQAENARKAAARQHAQAASLKGMKGEQAVALRKQIDDAERAWIEKNLTVAQTVRLVQVSVQWEGPAALVSRPVVADSLGLTREQRTALTEAVRQRDAARALPTYSRAEEQAFATRALSILTGPQKERWRSMIGRDFVPRIASAAGETDTRR